MNNYTKMTFASFLEKLKEGKYQGVAGARRAIGKSELTDDEKKKANKAVDKHFSDAAEAPAPPPTPREPQVLVKVPRKKSAATAPVEEPDSMKMTHRTVQVTRDAMEGLARARAADASVNVTEAVQTGANILGTALRKIHKALHGNEARSQLNGSSGLHQEHEESARE